MNIRTIIISLIFVASMFSHMEAQVVDYGLDNGVFSFEENTEFISTSKHSAASVSDEHAKLGSHSLKWEWSRRKSSISIDAPIPYLAVNPNPKETSVSSFVFWIYSPDRLDGELRFSFMKNGKECCHFDYSLNFIGWRGAWVAFDRDMQGTPVEDMDRVVISASKNLKRGTLYFDGIITASFQDVRYHTADWQARFINKETTNFWLTLNKFWDNELDIPVEDNITDKALSDFKTIEERFIALVTDNIKPLSFNEICQIYDSYSIGFNEDGSIKGRPVWFIRYGETYLNQGIPDAMPTFTKYGQTLRQLNDAMLKIAVSYMNEADPSIKKKIEDIYINLTAHLLDQGFAAGSGQGTLHHLGYSMRNFYTGAVIMKPVLKKAGLADDMQQAMQWFSGFGEVKRAPEVLGMDIDAFNTSLMGRFASVIMLEDGAEKYAYMKALSRWVDNGFKYTEGTRPCFKPDGCVVHHRKCYPEYAAGGFKGSVNAIWMLAGTEFAISEDSHSNQKYALLQMRFFSNLKNFPLAMSGRHPDGTRSLIPSQFAILADAGSPDGKNAIDKDLAEAYLRLNGTEGKWGEKFTDAGFIPEKSPVGGQYFGYNCSLSYRQDDWLLTIAGHSRYFWATETYRNENHYGRYLAHGSMQFLDKEGSYESGFRMDGWDWCHIPGTTAAAIPMEQMKADVLNVDEFSGYEEMLLSDEWFAGGVTYGTEAAAYSMILHEHDKYNGSLRARKSFFAFDDRVICIGSGLENSLEGSELHTTLFQNAIDDKEESVQNLKCDNTVILDKFGNAYYIKDADVCIRKGLQNSLHEETDAPTKGRFEKAYIDHGSICGPDIKGCRDSYEYMMVVKDREKRYAGQLPYDVVRADNTAHVVMDNESGLTGCSIFERTSLDSLITEISPAILIYKLSGNSLKMNISNPDFALYSGASDEVIDENGKRVERSVYGRAWIDNPCQNTTIELSIKGIWDIDASHDTDVEISYDGDTTNILVVTKESRTESIQLNRR